MDPLQLLAAKLQTMTQVALARELGVSTGYLNDVLQERREPGPKVLKALRLRRRVVYETIGKR